MERETEKIDKKRRRKELEEQAPWKVKVERDKRRDKAEQTGGQRREQTGEVVREMRRNCCAEG